MTSRFTEMHMKKIKARGVFIIPFLRDSVDFVGYHNGIMTKHPEWRARLGEMVKYGREWQRFVKYYDHCVKLMENKNYTELEEVLSWFDINICKLNYYEFPKDTSNVLLKEYLIIGSVIPRYHIDEFDIYPQCVIDKLPIYESSNENYLIKTRAILYNKHGLSTGWTQCTLYHPDKRYIKNNSGEIEQRSKLEMEFVNYINDNYIQYNLKMLELVLKRNKGEKIMLNEIPDYNNYSDDKKNIVVKLTYDDIKKILESNHLLTSEITDELINNQDSCSKINSTLYSLKCKLENFIKNNKTEYNNHITELDDKLNKINDLIKYFEKTYLDKYANEILVHQQMNEFVKNNCEIFSNIVYHYCPHYILYDEKDKEYNENDFNMCSAQIRYKSDNEKYDPMTCLLSISNNHYLHPNNNPEIYIKKWMGIEWVISKPIKKYIIYDEGLCNS
jgi:hypothetical protein